MDLFAYRRIDDLDALVRQAGIDVPRLRGYRIMRDELPVPEEELAETLNTLVGDYWWMESSEADPDWYDHSQNDYINGFRPPSIPKATSWKEFYGEDEEGWYETDPKFWRLKRVHRTSMFQRIGMLKARFKRQYELWNRFASQENVLYIHSRMGGTGIIDSEYEYEVDAIPEAPEGAPEGERRKTITWPIGWDVRDQPWFLGVCADAFDPTYCDIYAKFDTSGITKEEIE